MNLEMKLKDAIELASASERRNLLVAMKLDRDNKDLIQNNAKLFEQLQEHCLFICDLKLEKKWEKWIGENIEK